MQFVSAHAYTGTKPWDALDLVTFEQPTGRMSLTSGTSTTARKSLSSSTGEVDMHYRDNGVDKIQAMRAGDVCQAALGDEHVAHPRGEARILVVERVGSIRLDTTRIAADPAGPTPRLACRLPRAGQVAKLTRVGGTAP